MNLITRPHSLQKKVSLRPSFKKKNYKTLFQGSTPLEQQKKVCRNTRCAFFFFIDYKNRLIFLNCDILRISLIYAFSTSK